MTEIESKIEAVLFLSGDAITGKKLSRILDITEEEAVAAAKSLSAELLNAKSGIRVMEHEGSFVLATDPNLSSISEKMVKEEAGEDITPAALETLSLIAYLGPVSKPTIEYIRGEIL